MQFTIKADTKGWFLTPYKGNAVAEFTKDTPVTLVAYNEWWYATQGQVPGFPIGHPVILINTSFGTGHMVAHEQSRQRNIWRYDGPGRYVAPACGICGVDVGLVGVVLNPVPLDTRPLTICRDCAGRVGRLAIEARDERDPYHATLGIPHVHGDGPGEAHEHGTGAHEKGGLPL